METKYNKYMNLYDYTDYRDAIKSLVSQRKKVDSRFTFERLAEHIRVQKPYLSKVLSEKAHFSSDQLYLTLRYLDLKSDQKDFLNLLFEFSRTAIKTRKEELLKTLQLIREQQKRSEKFIQAKAVATSAEEIALYYLDPLHQYIHVFLSVEKYRANPESIAEVLGVARTRIFECIKNLENMGIIESSEEGIKIKERNFHLPKTSNLYPAWRERVRIFLLQKMQSTETDKQYNFAMTFSADKNTYAKIQKMFLDFLKEADASIKTAPYEDVFQLTFDLIPLTSR